MKPTAATLNPDQLRDIIRTMPAPLPPAERRRHSVSRRRVPQTVWMGLLPIARSLPRR